MERSIEQAFYFSPAWRKARKSYISTQGGLCERCRAKGLIVTGRIVHHKIHLTEENYKDPAIALNFDNFELLCQDCHNKEHFERKQKRYSFDENGVLRM